MIINIDWNNPISSSMSVSVMTFLSSIVFLYVFKPHFVRENSEYEDNIENDVNRNKVVLYSLLFAFLAGIVIFFARLEKDEKPPVKLQKSKSFNPSKINVSF